MRKIWAALVSMSLLLGGHAFAVDDPASWNRDQRLPMCRPASLRVSVNTASVAVPAAIDADVIASTRKWASTRPRAGSSSIDNSTPEIIRRPCPSRLPRASIPASVS